jgi:hypothetical protein
METVALKEHIKDYHLLAQTPMIHFQPDQTGATLRPSEVKPKLDRFLRRIKGDIPKSWLVSDQHDALNYKMRITRTEKREKLNIKDFKLYFANMGDGAMKDLVFADCNLQIICFIPELMKLIDENIGAFFVLHNFGTRQSKGFGGFLVEGCHSQLKVERIIQKYFQHYFYADFIYGEDIVARFDHAMVVYTCMKNGFTMGKKVFDGYAASCFLPSEIGTDKEYIKRCVVKGRKEDYDTYEFIRAVFGLAENYDYRKEGVVKVLQFDGTCIKGKQVVIPEKSIRDNTGIKRFQSPVQIKIFQDRMYFLFTQNYRDILNRVFVLMKERDWKQIEELIKHQNISEAQRRLQSAHHIATPNEVDIDFFVEDFVDYFNEERHILKTFPKNWKPSANLTLEKGGQN